MIVCFVWWLIIINVIIVRLLTHVLFVTYQKIASKQFTEDALICLKMLYSFLIALRIRSLSSVPEEELRRFRDVFKQLASEHGCIAKEVFFRDVLGVEVPKQLAEVNLFLYL